MNEFYFFFHIFILIAFILFSLRWGKECLIAIFALQMILANLFVTKQMVCFGLHITCTDVYTVGALFSLNLLQQYFGKKLAKQAIWITFFLLLFFVAMSQLHLKYFPSPFDEMQQPFEKILGCSPRIMITSFCVALLTQRCDLKLFAFFKKRPLFLRFGGASLISQLLDTVLFTFIALYGIIHKVGDVILMSYSIKVAIIFCIAPFTILSKRFARNAPLQI